MPSPQLPARRLGSAAAPIADPGRPRSPFSTAGRDVVTRLPRGPEGARKPSENGPNLAYDTCRATNTRPIRRENRTSWLRTGNSVPNKLRHLGPYGPPLGHYGPPLGHYGPPLGHCGPAFASSRPCAQIADPDGHRSDAVAAQLLGI